MTLTIKHASLTGAAANPDVLVDGPKWDADHTVTGDLPVSQLNGGSGASASTFWRGDGTWAAAGGAPGGSNTQVQYNNNGALGGISGATTNGTALTLVAPVLGTPASGTLTNCTGLPVSTGISGTGTGVLTALAVNVGSAGAVIVNGGALGTPSSGTLTSCTGLPLSTGVTGNLPVANLNSGTSASSSTFWRGDGTWATPPGSISSYSSTLGADVNLSVIGTWYDGPSISQGTTGTFLVIGHASLKDTGASAAMAIRLTDGTTVHSASGYVYNTSAGARICASFAAIVTNPSGNLKMQAQNASTTTGKLVANDVGSGNETQLVAIKIA